MSLQQFILVLVSTAAIMCEGRRTVTFVQSGDGGNATLTLTPKQVTFARIAANSTVALELAPGSPNDTAFWIFESHTQHLPLLLTPSDPRLSSRTDEKYGVSSHAGLVVSNDASNRTAFAYVTNPNSVLATAVILVRAYSASAPVPGACNKTNATGNINHYRPGLQVQWNAHVIELNFSNAGLFSALSSSCGDPDEFEYYVYQRFLDHRNFGEDYYLTSLGETMLLEKKIEQFGTLVSADFVREPDQEGIRKVTFGAYPGVASIFAVVVRHSNNQSSVYVASATYGCHLDKSEPLNCEVMWFAFTKVLCAFAFFLGLFIAFLGHRFFSTSQFMFAFVVGAIAGYILLENVSSLGYSGTLGLTMLLGLSVGAIWLSIWIFFGIPILAVALPTLLLGFLTACLAFFLPAFNVATFISDQNYWLTLCAMSCVVPVVLLSFTKQASILSCVVIGTFAVVVPIDHYTGASMKYILVNLLRRATVSDYNYAVLQVPFQTVDIALTFFWVVLALVALLFQHVRERNRAPFPPNAYQTQRWPREEMDNALNESSPLLGDNGDENERHRLGPEVLEEIRQAAHDAVNAASRLSTSQGSMQTASAPPERPESASSRRRLDIPLLSDEELLLRRNRDLFRPPIPTADAVYHKL